MPENNMPERWVSMKKICVHLDTNRFTVTKCIETKNMPAVKIGRLWKFKISEVDKWVHAGGAAGSSLMEIDADTERAMQVIDDNADLRYTVTRLFVHRYGGRPMKIVVIRRSLKAKKRRAPTINTGLTMAGLKIQQEENHNA